MLNMFPLMWPQMSFSDFLVKEVWPESGCIWSDDIFRQIWLTDLTERAAGEITARHAWSEGPTPVCYLERFHTFMHVISQPRAGNMQRCKLPQNVKMPRAGIEDNPEIKAMQMTHPPATFTCCFARCSFPSTPNVTPSRQQTIKLPNHF